MLNDFKFLYRGISEEKYIGDNNELRPKRLNEPFLKSFGWDDPAARWDVIKWDENLHNAVVEHEFDREGRPTSGHSTTPFFERAKLYATNNGKVRGYIFKIDCKLLSEFEISTHRVSEHLSHPSVPEDDEVILVAKDFGNLPKDIIIDMKEVVLMKVDET